jgi:hypothetical protein
MTSPTRRPMFLGFDRPLASLVRIAGKRKKHLTCTQDTTIAKLEQLRSTRLILHVQTVMTRHAKALSKVKGHISLQVPIKYY